MHAPCPELEQNLLDCLRSQGAAYARAREALYALQARLDAGETLHSVCPELQEVLAATRDGDGRLTHLQEQWRAAGLSAGPELASEIAQHRSRLEELVLLVNRLEATAVAERERLAPRLDEVARGRRMMQAYASAERAY